MHYKYMSNNIFYVKYSISFGGVRGVGLGVVIVQFSRTVTSLFGKGSRGPLNWEYYQHFGKLRKIAHFFNEEQNNHFLLNLQQS